MEEIERVSVQIDALCFLAGIVTVNLNHDYMSNMTLMLFMMIVYSCCAELRINLIKDLFSSEFPTTNWNEQNHQNHQNVQNHLN